MNAQNRSYRHYIQDILEAASRAQRFVEGYDFETFQEDERTIFATIRALEIIGEATKQIPPEVRAQAPDVPWRAMAGMRDKLIHSYVNVDIDVVWQTVTQRLPNIIPELERLLNE